MNVTEEGSRARQRAAEAVAGHREAWSKRLKEILEVRPDWPALQTTASSAARLIV